MANSEKIKMNNFTTKPALHYTGTLGEEPIGIHVIPSGWQGNYHVIIEYGDVGEWDNYFMTKLEIKERYNIDIEDLYLSELIKNSPEDYILGSRIRQLFEK